MATQAKWSDSSRTESPNHGFDTELTDGWWAGKDVVVDRTPAASLAEDAVLGRDPAIDASYEGAFTDRLLHTRHLTLWVIDVEAVRCGTGARRGSPDPCFTVRYSAGPRV